MCADAAIEMVEMLHPLEQTKVLIRQAILHAFDLPEDDRERLAKVLHKAEHSAQTFGTWEDTSELVRDVYRRMAVAAQVEQRKIEEERDVSM